MGSSCPLSRRGAELCGGEEDGRLCSSAGRRSLSCSTSEPPGTSSPAKGTFRQPAWARTSAVWAWLALPLQEQDRAGQRLVGLIPRRPAGTEAKAASAEQRDPPSPAPRWGPLSRRGRSEGSRYLACTHLLQLARSCSRIPVMYRSRERFAPHWPKAGASALDD